MAAAFERATRRHCGPPAAGFALLLALAPCLPLHAQAVIYRCTDARGVVTLQNDTACPKGSRQEKRTVEAVPSAPPPVATPAPATVSAPPPGAQFEVAQAPATAGDDASSTAAQAAGDAPAPLPLPATDTAPAQRLPPPPLYQCNTAENDSYLSDTSDPKPRCVRMQTVGIDGSQQLGAGQACSMTYDQCQRVADGAACDAWRKRVNEAQAAWTFARAENVDAAKAEYERIARVVAQTTCNAAP